jgi:glycosyltransferase involved in cell wall biosynthesis
LIVKTAVVIPAFNEEKHVGEVVEGAKRHADTVIVVDDNSSDSTREVARASGATVVRHDRNLGYGAAVRTGFVEALHWGADQVVTIDADGQHETEDIPKIIKALKGGADFVVASRFMPGGREINTTFYRRFTLKHLWIPFFRFISGLKVTDPENGMRGYSRGLIESIGTTENRYSFCIETVLRVGYSKLTMNEVPTTVRYTKRDTPKMLIVHPTIVFIKSIVMALRMRFIDKKHDF